MAVSLRRPCRCGHEVDAHEHYRRGSDCSACDCARFQGRFVLTLSLGRAPVAAGRVVVPDAVPYPDTPYVRPTHTTGMPALHAPAVPPLVRPRTAADVPRLPEQSPSA